MTFHIWTIFSFVLTKILTYLRAKLGFVSIKIPYYPISSHIKLEMKSVGVPILNIGLRHSSFVSI